jgi:two-component system, NtrC family, response regulator AtoC
VTPQNRLESTLNTEMRTAEVEIKEISDDHSFIAASPIMRRIRAQAALLAKVDVPVLIHGESGSGREAIARLVHQLSGRSHYKFVKVNCAALDGDLLENELLGYDSVSPPADGIGTGALRLCDGGTILLHEITEVAPRLQAKLLSIIQERHFGRENRPDLDVRILASTTANVEMVLVQKRLREDLYDRLSAFTIQIPPLRERRDELQALLAHFMNRMARHYRLPARPFSDVLLRACEEHSWPGNLRELEIFVQRYLVMGDELSALSGLRTKSGFLANSGIGMQSAPPATTGENWHLDDSSGLKTLVRSIKGETEKGAISNTLEKTRWNRKEAARLLGISYRGLLYKIEQYQLTGPRRGLR